MSKLELTKLLPKLRYNLHDRRRLKNVDGPKGRHEKIRKVVTALFKHERIELNYMRADESRGYAERLISDAIRYGDCHKQTMEMASYWLLEKQLVHKLFKVLVPRYQNFEISYTKMWRAPYPTQGMRHPKCVLELRNNIYPPLGPDTTNHKNLLHNVLLSAARKEYEKEKASHLNLNSDKMADAEVVDRELLTEDKVKVDSVLGENFNSESLKISETEGKEFIKEENKEHSQETVKMSETKKTVLFPEENIELDHTLDKDLDMHKMKIGEVEEKEVQDKSKEK